MLRSTCGRFFAALGTAAACTLGNASCADGQSKSFVADYYVLIPVSADVRSGSLGVPPIIGYSGADVPTSYTAKIGDLALTLKITKDNFRPSFDLSTPIPHFVEVSGCFNETKLSPYLTTVTYMCDVGTTDENYVDVMLAGETRRIEFELRKAGVVTFYDGP